MKIKAVGIDSHTENTLTIFPSIRDPRV